MVLPVCEFSRSELGLAAVGWAPSGVGGEREGHLGLAAAG